jgi:hypothetical protein
MGKDQERIDSGLLQKGPLRITCDDTGMWSEDGETSIGTTLTSGIYQMKPGDTVIIAISDFDDGNALIILPSLQEACGKFYSVSAPTAATDDDVIVKEKETGAVLATYGDLDADLDHAIYFSDGDKWRTVLDGVA